MSEPLHVIGLMGSPYTRKVLAYLRYRGIPYKVEWRSPTTPFGDRIAPRPALLPTVYFPDEPQPVTDSTPIIQRLEAEVEARPTAPADPVLGFLSLLVEDFADEWLTKPMFHFRWSYADDIENAGDLITFWTDPSLPDAMARDLASSFAERQIDRLRYVGSNEETAHVIETGYQRFLKHWNGLIEQAGFLLGARPSVADFAIYGQLTQLVLVDPTPSAMAEKVSRRIRAWVDRLEDLSGLPEGDWLAPADALDRLAPLLEFIGRVYAPLLLANDAAVRGGDESFETDIDGVTWRQASFRYHVKCLGRLREAHDRLPTADKELIAAPFAQAGLSALFQLPGGTR